MICSNCGYENNSDDVLSCNLCGKVFRKEVREDKKEEREVYEFKKKPQIYWHSEVKIEVIGLILITILCITLAIITGIEWEPVSLKDVFLFLLVGLIGLTIWRQLRESPEEREERLRKKQEIGIDPTGVTHVCKGIWKVIEGLWKSKGEERIGWILAIISFIIAIILGVILKA